MFPLKGLLQNDSALDAKIGADARDFVNRNKWLGICADVANGSRHLRLDNPARIDSAARVEKRTLKFDTAGFSPEAFLSRDFVIILAAGTHWLALEATKNAVAAWDGFLAQHGLLPDAGSDHSRGSQTGTLQ